MTRRNAETGSMKNGKGERGRGRSTTDRRTGGWGGLGEIAEPSWLDFTQPSVPLEVAWFLR